jgi:nicotinate-nucleotide pyrophosphorylase (carboxylating)
MPQPHSLKSSVSSGPEANPPPWELIFNNGFRKDLFNKAIDLAFLEDLGMPPVDLTTSALKGADKETKATIYCKSLPAVMAGTPIIELVFKRLDPEIKIRPLSIEGQKIIEIPIATTQIIGKARAILGAERIALNLLQRMCAVATRTSQFVEKAAKHKIAILDTRKTTPGLRLFEKYAVLVGGGENHRFGLNDAILIKDNHIQMSGGITEAVKLLRLQYPDKPLEVECTSLEEVRESLNLKVDRILLDNMSPDLVKEAVRLVQNQCFIEVSGGINLSNIDGYLQKGVNAISIGALTHSSISVDLSLEVENK